MNTRRTARDAVRAGSKSVARAAAQPGPPLPSRSQRTGRIAARIAWRTALRHPGRSALIAALVALPTIGLTAGTVLVASTVPTTHEKLAYILGRTEAMVQVYSPPDATLQQSPTVAGWTERDIDGNGNPAGFDADDVALAPDEVLPAGTRILSITESTATVRTAAGVDALQLIEGDAGDAALEGRYHLAEGRAPRGHDEIALSASALPRLGVALGGTVQITAPRAVTAAVVGVIEDRGRDAADAVMFAADGAVTGVQADDRLTNAVYYLPDTVLDWDAVQALNRHGLIAYSRHVVENPPAPGEYMVGAGYSGETLNGGYLELVLLIGGFLIFEVCLLAGSAFIVGMRADQRALATIASVGGEPRLIARIVSMGGVVLGGVGGLIGVGLGVLAAWGYYMWTDDGNALTLPGFHPWAWALATVFAIAVGSGWIAALAAARGARRIDVVAALRGSRRPRPARTRRAVAGGGVVLVGAGLLLAGGVVAVFSTWPKYDGVLVVLAMGTLVAGAIVLQLGIVLTTPVLLATASRFLSRVGEAARLAGRDASRNHARSVPATAAVMTTVFIAAFLMTFLTSTGKTTVERWQYDAPIGTMSVLLLQSVHDQPGQSFPSDEQVTELSALMEGVLDPTQLRTLDAVLAPSPWGRVADAEWTVPRVHGEAPCTLDSSGNVVSGCPVLPVPFQVSDNPRIYVGDSDDLAMMLGHEPDAEATRMLQDGGVVSFWPEYIDHGELTLDTWRDAQWANGPTPTGTPEHTTTLPARYLDPGIGLRFGVMVSSTTADALGLEYGPAYMLASLSAPPTDQQNQALWAGIPAISDSSWGRYEAGPPQNDGVAWAALGLTALISFAAASVAIGLARADGCRDEEVLDAIGAPPRLRRGVAFWQAIVIAGIGTLLGTVVGMLPILALHLATILSPVELDANGPMPDFAAPWPQLGLTVVGVPLLIALGSWATATRRRTAVRRIP